jgi:hypothetical protein
MRMKLVRIMLACMLAVAPLPGCDRLANIFVTDNYDVEITNVGKSQVRVIIEGSGHGAYTFDVSAGAYLSATIGVESSSQSYYTMNGPDFRNAEVMVTVGDSGTNKTYSQKAWLHHPGVTGIIVGNGQVRILSRDPGEIPRLEEGGTASLPAERPDQPGLPPAEYPRQPGLPPAENPRQ